MPSTFVFTLSLVLLALIGAIAFLVSKTQRNAKLPPGPKGLPILGNLRDLPPEDGLDWEFWYKHKDLYGPISSVTVLGRTIVILNEPHDATMLFEQRSAIYSSRTSMPFAGEM